MFYTVYKTTNKLNGKIYVGVHKTNNLDDDYLGSGKLLGYAINKYGIENFEKEILAVFDKSSEMFEMESEIVNEEFVNRDDTYNLKLGGEGGWDYLDDGSPEHLSRCSKGGKNVDISHRVNGYKKAFQNKEWCEKRSEALSKGLQKFYANGGVGSFKGKKHSEEFKQMMSKKMSESQSGFGNSQYGTMWICNIELQQNRKISKDSKIPDNWCKGRNKWKQNEKNKLKEKGKELKELKKGKELKEKKKLIEFYWDEFKRSNLSTISEFMKITTYPYSRVSLITSFKKNIPEYSKMFKQGRKNKLTS